LLGDRDLAGKTFQIIFRPILLAYDPRFIMKYAQIKYLNFLQKSKTQQIQKIKIGTFKPVFVFYIAENGT